MSSYDIQPEKRREDLLWGCGWMLYLFPVGLVILLIITWYFGW